jgi:hypothetical protein
VSNLSIEVKEIEYENYGNCIQMSNRVIDVVVTVDIGPRIVRFGYIGEENVLYNDLERKYVNNDPKIAERYGKDAAFYLYGGHRVWLYPERMPETYYPDNDPVVYGILTGGVSFTPARQKRNEMQLGFEIVMSDGTTDIMVVHSAKNCSKEKQICALSAITAMKGGGTQYIPMNRDNNSMLVPNRILTAWPYTDIQDKRITFTNKHLTVRHDGAFENALKLGTNNLMGCAAYVNGDYTMVKRYVHNAQAQYPDSGCSYETYVCKDYAEMQSMSPLYSIEPGEGIRHVENLSLFKTGGNVIPTGDDEIDRYFTSLK